MPRILCPLLLALLLVARPAFAEEEERPPDGIDPAAVARLLLSSDETERARGVELLRERIAQGGDVRTWLVAMARAQAAWADDEERLVERWIEDVLHGAPERADRARRLIAALGREATRRLLQVVEAFRADTEVDATKEAPAAGAAQAPQAPRVPQAEPRPEPMPVEAEPPAPAGPPVARLRATVIEVPRAEIMEAIVSWNDRDAAPFFPLRQDEPVVVSEGAVSGGVRGILELAATLPEARTRGTWSDDPVAPGRAVLLAPGDTLRYRSRTRKTKGAWAVATDTLARGLQVSFVLQPGTDEERTAVVVARYVRVPDPLPTEQVRPAEDVEPIELDRPEWESASMHVETRLGPTGERVAAFFPGIVPDKVVVVGLQLLPLVTPQAADVPK